MFSSSSGVFSSRGSLTMVWHVVIWSIWKSRNDIIFSGSFVPQKEVEDMCIFLAWKWYLGMSMNNLCIVTP